ncbi:hypothetical protein R3I93_013178 [Phoxinus phoxinus]|uniref:Uncharacterized protein n=1 Tax=Phoxinus phoxinus TaxID=58324 RepID=A0AAN9CZJ7_9TELE
MKDEDGSGLAVFRGLQALPVCGILPARRASSSATDTMREELFSSHTLDCWKKMSAL